MHANSHTARLLSAAWLDAGVCGCTSYQGNYVRDFLYEQQRGCCAICGIDGKWNGVTLALIIDQINGDASNNRRVPKVSSIDAIPEHSNNIRSAYQGECSRYH